MSSVADGSTVDLPIGAVPDGSAPRLMLNGRSRGSWPWPGEGNLRRAAELLYVSQPALTASIQGLEEGLGTPLFQRTRSGMELTHAGRAFLPYAERALESLRGGVALVDELSEGVIGELTIGAAPAVGAYVLPELLALYTQGHPNVRLVVRTSHPKALVDIVVRGEVQLAIAREMRDAPITSRPLFEDELALVARPDHLFAAAGRIDIAAIHGARLIPFDRTSSYYELTNALFRSAGVVPRGVMELDNIEAAKQMVERGLGVALLPGTAVAQSLAEGSLTEVELAGAGPIERRMVTVEHQASRGQPETAASFVVHPLQQWMLPAWRACRARVPRWLLPERRDLRRGCVQGPRVRVPRHELLRRERADRMLRCGPHLRRRRHLSARVLRRRLPVAERVLRIDIRLRLPRRVLPGWPVQDRESARSRAEVLPERHRSLLLRVPTPRPGLLL